MTAATPSGTPTHTVVMGGSSGIGEATAALFAAQGAEVTITGRDRAKLDEAAARIGGKTITYRMDATDQGDIEAFFATTAPVDHLVVAVSGAAGSGPFADLDLDDLAHGFDAKFWPHLRILKAALPRLTEHASITLITAASARAAFPGTSGLAAINGALEAMIPPLAVELARAGSTPYRPASSTPLGGAGSPRSSARSCSRGSRRPRLWAASAAPRKWRRPSTPLP